MVSFDVLNHNVLKEITKRYNLHVQIRRYTKLSKAELVNELEKHLILNDDGSVDFKKQSPQLFSSDYINELKLKKLPYSELRKHVKELGHATERGKKRLNKSELLDVATQKKQIRTPIKEVSEKPKQAKNIEPNKSVMTKEEKEFNKDIIANKATFNTEKIRQIYNDKYKKKNIEEYYTLRFQDASFKDLDDFEAEINKHKNDDAYKSKLDKSKLKEVIQKQQEIYKELKNMKLNTVDKVDEFINLRRISNFDTLFNEGDKLHQETNQHKPNKNNENKLIKVNDEFFKIVDEILKIKNGYTLTNKRANFNEKIVSLISQISKPTEKQQKEDYVKQITDAVGSHDFYPTPPHILEGFNDQISNSQKLLEPTAGLGYILNYVRKLNPTCEKTAIEFSDLVDLLKLFNPDTEINPQNKMDFLAYKPKNIDFDTIVINPPFSRGSDKRYYLDFLFHCLYLMNKSSVGHSNICLICPDIVKDNKEIDLTNIFAFAGKPKTTSILERYGFKITDKDYKILTGVDENNDNEKCDDILKTFDFWQCQKLSKVSGFAGTSIQANRYIITMYSHKSSGSGFKWHGLKGSGFIWKSFK